MLSQLCREREKVVETKLLNTAQAQDGQKQEQKHQSAMHPDVLLLLQGETDMIHSRSNASLSPFVWTNADIKPCLLMKSKDKSLINIYSKNKIPTFQSPPSGESEYNSQNHCFHQSEIIIQSTSTANINRIFTCISLLRPYYTDLWSNI